jgi:hypothetical protein
MSLDSHLTWALIKSWKFSRTSQYYDSRLLAIGAYAELLTSDTTSLISDEERYRIIYFIRMFETYHILRNNHEAMTQGKFVRFLTRYNEGGYL